MLKTGGKAQSQVTLLAFFPRGHHRVAAVTEHLGSGLNESSGFLLDQLDDFIKLPETDLFVGHLTTAELHKQFHFVAMLQELNDLVHFHVEIVLIDPGAELHLFNFDNNLFFLRLRGFLLGLVLVLTVVHQLHYRRTCGGGDLDQIQLLVLGDQTGLGQCNDSVLLTIVTNQTDFVRTNFLVNAWLLELLAYNPPPYIGAYCLLWKLTYLGVMMAGKS